MAPSSVACGNRGGGKAGPAGAGASGADARGQGASAAPPPLARRHAGDPLRADRAAGEAGSDGSQAACQSAPVSRSVRTARAKSPGGGTGRAGERGPTGDAWGLHAARVCDRLQCQEPRGGREVAAGAMPSLAGGKPAAVPRRLLRSAHGPRRPQAMRARSTTPGPSSSSARSRSTFSPAPIVAGGCGFRRRSRTRPPEASGVRGRPWSRRSSACPPKGTEGGPSRAARRCPLPGAGACVRVPTRPRAPRLGRRLIGGRRGVPAGAVWSGSDRGCGPATLGSTVLFWGMHPIDNDCRSIFTPLRARVPSPALFSRERDRVRVPIFLNAAQILNFQ